MRPKMRIELAGGRADENRVSANEFVLLIERVLMLTLMEGKRLAGEDVPEEVVEQSCRLDILPIMPGSMVCELELQAYSDTEENVLGTRAMNGVVNMLNQIRSPEFPEREKISEDTLKEIQKIGSLLERSCNRISFKVSSDGRINEGIIDEEVRSKILIAQIPTVHIEDTSVSGILYQLQDKPRVRKGKYFNAEIFTQTGETWAVRFNRALLNAIGEFWRENVKLTGVATYYPTQRPRIIVDSIDKIEKLAPIDFEKALEEGFGIASDVFSDIPFDELIKDLQ